MSDFGRPVVSIFEVDRIRCALNYGESPCQAALGVTGTRKCYNGIATCQDEANFTPETVVDRFLMDQEGTLQHYAPFVPSIESMRVTRPLSINLAGMDEDSAKLGTRENLTVRFRDHLHSDLGHDKYRLERPTGDASLVHSGTANPDSNTGEMTDFLVLAPDAAGEDDAYPTVWDIKTDKTGAVVRTIASQYLLRLVSGPGSPQERRIASYSAADKIARVDNPWDSGPLPDETTGYEIREAYDPYKLGSHWGKWIARNPFYPNYSCRAYRGYLGDPVESMRVQHYIVDRIDGPSGGMATLVAKDIFSKIEAKKAAAPFPSRGELSADLTGTPSGFSVTPVEIGDQPEEEGGYASITDSVSGYVSIGDEIVHVLRSGEDFTFVPDENGDERGCLETEAEDHDAEDLVQGVFSAVSESPHDIVYRLLVDYAKIDPANIDKGLWDERAAQIQDLYTGRVAKPEPVLKLVAEIMRQAGFTVWPDISTGMIDLVALRPGAISPTVNNFGWIVDDPPIRVEPQPSRRVSQVWVYYGMRNPTGDLDDDRNFHSRVLRPDVPVVLDLEGELKYGTPSIVRVFSRWIPKGGRQAAERCGDRIFAMGQTTPIEATFRLHASKEGELKLARYFALQTADVQEVTGAVKPVAMATVEIARGEFETSYRAQSVVFSVDAEDGVRRIFIENNDYNRTLRALHDLQFPAPVGGTNGEVVEVYLLDTFTVGSTSTGSPGLRTGFWPDGVTLRLFIIGRCQGKGGLGGNGAIGGSNGFPGGDGGPALRVEYPIILGGDGEIFGGGGGGGGGPMNGPVAGAGGGGGAGTDGGPGGSTGGNGSNLGGTGTPDAGGEGSDGGSPTRRDGGDGGGPGLAGQPGESPGTTSPGPGGNPGPAIDGISLVTFDTSANLDIRGPQIN